MRRTVETLVVFAAVGLLLRTWCAQGLVVPFQVASGSMAPTLLGPHRRIVCGDCGFTFFCSADRRDDGARIVCPNCTYGANNLDDRPVVAGDRLLVDKTAFQLRPPRRWEVVAFRDPRHPSLAAVKRVVGLPGEAIQICDGDVYADGQIVRKTLAQQRATALLVHDAAFPPRLDAAAPPRWQPEQNGSRWAVAGGRFTHPEVRGQPSADWLSYVHRRRIFGPHEKSVEAPITSECDYNQTLGERGESFDPATDLMLSFNVADITGKGELAVRIGDGWEEFEVWVDPHERRLRLLRNKEPLPDPETVGWDNRSAVPPEATSHLAYGRWHPHMPPTTYHLLSATGGTALRLSHPTNFAVEVSTFDQQFLVAIDGRPVVVLPYQRTGSPMRRDSRRLAIGCRALGVEIGEVRVFRDTYYTAPMGGHGAKGVDSAYTLGWDEYYVLGDNSPISDDSRTWPQGLALCGRLLVGKPVLVHFPASYAPFGGHFHVPDLSRIRYIR